MHGKGNSKEGIVHGKERFTRKLVVYGKGKFIGMVVVHGQEK